MDWVASFAWNRWPASRGMGGRNQWNTQRNPDGTEKSPRDQVDQLKKKKERNQRAIENTDKSEQNLKDFLKKNKNNPDAFEDF